MQCEVLRSELIRPLQLVCSTGARLASPSVLHLILSATPTGLCLTSSDLGFQLRVLLPLKSCADPGTLAVPGRKFLDLCRMLPESEVIQLREQQGRFELRTTKTRVNLSLLDADQLRILDEFEPLGEGEIPVEALKILVSGVSFAMANQDVRHYLNGLLLSVSSQGLRAVATDGHRLAYGALTGHFNLSAPHVLLVPRKSILELLRFLEFLSGPTCFFSYGKKGFSLSTESACFTTQLLSGQFPSYEATLQTALIHQVVVDSGALRQALLRAAILSQEKPRKVKLKFSPDQLNLLSTNTVQEQVEEELSLNGFSGAAIEIGFDLAYLLDVLNAIKGPKVTIQFQSPSHLVKFSDPQATAFEYVVMPMLI